jgi:transposase-like protein
MPNYARTLKRYSVSFKQKVVNEIEQEGLSISEARRRYNIGGVDTIQCWIRKFGKNHLLNTIVRIEMKDEKDRVKELEEEVKKLKIALADAVLARDVYKTTLEVTDEHYKTDLKKNSDDQLLKKQKKNTDTP